MKRSLIVNIVLIVTGIFFVYVSGTYYGHFLNCRPTYSGPIHGDCFTGFELFFTSMTSGIIAIILFSIGGVRMFRSFRKKNLVS